IGADPFPELRGLRIEAAEREQAELASLSALRVEPLHAGIVRAHDGGGGLDELVVEAFDALLGYQLGANALQLLGGLELGREALLAFAQRFLRLLALADVHQHVDGADESALGIM